MLFNESENDYKKIVEEFEEDTKMRFETLEAGKKFLCLFPGTQINFKIPVRFFKNRKTNKTQRTLGLQQFFKIELNEEEIQIPIKMLTPFFSSSINSKGGIGIMAEQEEKLSSKFKYNPKALYELLTYAGYINSKSVNDRFILPKATLTMEDNKLICIGSFLSEDADNELWTEFGSNRKILLARSNHILFKNKESFTILIK